MQPNRSPPIHGERPEFFSATDRLIVRILVDLFNDVAGFKHRPFPTTNLQQQDRLHAV